MLIKILLLIAFFAVMTGTGLYFRKHNTNVDKFVLGGRAVGPWLTAFAYGTSYFSAVVFVGYAGQFGWKFGISAVWIGIGNAMVGSLLAWVVLGRRTRVMTRHLGSSTMPEFFGARFGSKGMKIGASAITFIFLVPYTASLYNGLSRLFVMAFGIDFTFCIAVMALLTGVYVIAGGYVATAVNDFIQGLIMLGGIIATAAVVLGANGGFASSLDALARVSDIAVSETPGIFASFFGPDPLNLLGVVLLTSIGTWGLPQMVQKFYAIKSEDSIGKGTVISTLFALVVAGGSYFLGGFGRLFSGRIDVAAEGFDAVIPAMLSGFSPLLVGIVVMLVLSASMSTLSALVMASSTTFTLDFLKGGIVKSMDEQRQLLVIRALIAVFILISSVIAVIQYKGGISLIAQLMGISCGALAGAFLAPFLYGLYWRGTTPASVWTCFLFSTLLMTANIFFRDDFPVLLRSPINAGAFAMLAGLILVPLVSLFTRASETRMLDEIFSCYEKPVTVRSQESLGSGNGTES
ncbi:MAG: sodium:solute symporter [Desulfovibrio sp.]|jgi:SSS family solute:Na+ symporter|nr:sodium:solute symporter [Desulfovibrio sp.]